MTKPGLDYQQEIGLRHTYAKKIKPTMLPLCRIFWIHDYFHLSHYSYNQVLLAKGIMLKRLRRWLGLNQLRFRLRFVYPYAKITILALHIRLGFLIILHDFRYERERIAITVTINPLNCSR